MLAEPTVVKPRQFKSDVLPPGFLSTSKKVATKKPLSDDQLAQLKTKKAWEIATGPAKQLPMNLVMGYMTGNSLQIIPITTTFMILLNPLKAIFSETSKAFAGLDTGDQTQLMAAKLVFVVCQLANMAIGVYKLYKMGLIPHAPADWLAWKLPVVFEQVVNVLN